MADILDKALDGRVTTEQAIKYMNEVGDADVVQDIVERVGFVAGMRDSGIIVAFDVVDWLKSKCRGNDALLMGALALMLSSGALSAHTVIKGDTLWGLSGGKVDKILVLNPSLKKDTVLKPGMKVVLPSKASFPKSPKSPSPSGDIYTVMNGDTFGAIAKSLGVSTDALKEANPQVKDINKVSVGDKLNIPTHALDPKVDKVAQVLYSEVSTQCSEEELKLVCQVIANRISNRAFGGKVDAHGVMMAPYAFSAVKNHNNPWNDYRKSLNKYSERCYDYATRLMKGERSFASDVDGIVYYHDKSINVPSGWTTPSWKPELVKTTTHFKFYRIVPND